MSTEAQIDLIHWSIFALWTGWLASWLIAARWSAPIVKRPDRFSQLPNLVITTLGAACLFVTMPASGKMLTQQLYHCGIPVAWALVGLITFGLAFCWWARIHLGRMWSGTVTQKEGHKIIDTGPYGIVRHPIYTGILTALYATAAIKADWLAFLGAGLITLGLYNKARLEERFLSTDLGSEYGAYRKRVPMLVPLIGV